MINIDTLNLLRLNSVSACQPVDSNTRKTHTRTRIILGLDCQLAYSWEMVTMATPDVASEGLVVVYFEFHASFPRDTPPRSPTKHSHTEGP